ncbi:MAG: PP2C family protein-serine/threonine phosphatase, partial [Bacteroidota bacterium]
LFNYRNPALQEAVEELNERVMQSAQGEKYITFFVGKYNKSTRKLQYINCGHNPPLLIQDNGEAEWLKLGSIGLGMFEEIPAIKTGELTLLPNTLVICYTDGLTELENEDLEEYGTHRLEESVRKHFYVTMAAMNQLIIKELNTFRGTMPYVDDTALLSCRFL